MAVVLSAQWNSIPQRLHIPHKCRESRQMRASELQRTAKPMSFLRASIVASPFCHHDGVARQASLRCSSSIADGETAASQAMEEAHLPLLLRSLASLRSQLQQRGSDLVLRCGACADVIPSLCREVRASSLWTEEAVESSWRDAASAVSAACRTRADTETEAETEGSATGSSVALQEWQAHVFDFPDPFTSNHDSYLQQRGEPLAPLPAPATLPPLPSSLADTGSLPSLESLLSLAAGNPTGSPSKLPRRSTPSGAWRGGGSNRGAELAAQAGQGEGQALRLLAMYLAVGVAREGEGEQERKYRELAGRIAALAGVVEWEEEVPDAKMFGELRSAVADLEALPRSSFHALFSPSLSLGLLSPRLVHAAASHALSLSPAPPPPLLAVLGAPRPLEAAQAALASVEASQWYLHLALHAYQSPPLPPTALLLSPSQLASSLPPPEPSAPAAGDAAEGAQQDVAVGHWRWRGVLVQYAMAGTEGPAILLVHGFGAFWQHWRGQLQLLAARGYRVWALTLPGFGRAEKPFWVYTQHTWASCVADFAADVVQEPVLLGGNSIGVDSLPKPHPLLAGYTAALAAATHPELVAGLLLFNSAGRLSGAGTKGDGSNAVQLIPDGSAGVGPTPSSPPSPVSPASSGPPLFVARLVAGLLLLYLRTSAPAQLRRCYPKIPERADEWLLGEIARGGGDPGALEVIQSVFYLPKPEPLNSLITRFPNPTIVIQGRYDPLNDAVTRANALKGLCPTIELQFVEAGHCPHDELPERVVDIMDKWIYGKVVTSA